MQAIILAAGCGSRLAPVLKGKPKCLAQIGGVSLLEYQLAILRHFGIRDICLVLGYQAHQVLRIVGDRCQTIINHRYAETNSLYSLSLARKWVRDSFLLINSDVLAHFQIYQRLLQTPGNALAYDSWSGDEAEQMKVTFNKGKELQQIRKSLSLERAQGESIGLLKFTASAKDGLFREAQTALEVGGENQWASAAIERLAYQQSITGVDMVGLPWVEIDFPQDWQYACQTVWPKIRKTVSNLSLKSPVVFSSVLEPVQLYSQVA